MIQAARTFVIVSGAAVPARLLESNNILKIMMRLLGHADLDTSLMVSILCPSMK